MNYSCKECGKTLKKVYPGTLCQSCYKYKVAGGTYNQPPPAGVIAHDSRGCVICHICGRAYRRLGSHIKESHGMTIAEYKETYGLCASSKTTESRYSAMMRKYAYDNNMPQRLLAAGVDTRIKTGESDKRKNKKVRLQERINKRSRGNLTKG